ncbi:ATP-binding protein [Flammeovirgaceae bacterium SG7u.111]|nr:ATP-binding protein [Flammeovirgaceae bacterium SG7u.132]WPO36496.1 ATP-binding protein [Flammeovirgaceae bacterium SG7u.111]
MRHANLIRAFQYLESLIHQRISDDLNGESKAVSFKESDLPRFSAEDDDAFSTFVTSHRLTIEETIVLMLALTPHVFPQFFDAIIAEHLPHGGDFPAFGGVKGTNHRGTIPTGETALYILAGNNLERRFQVQRLFSFEHAFAKENILGLEAVKYGEPPMSGKIILDDDYIDLFTIGSQTLPKMSTNFPAQHIQTAMSWEDVVLNKQTAEQINELEAWIRHNDTLLNSWGMKKKIKPGYRALFYGPPGTGKTLTATLLGKSTGRDVFKVDLSMVVSKYIGETEKNLSTLFDKAKNKNWILFFDEADALFGKRTGVRDAHDKYANQEVSYLLQRVESYNGLTILASNFKDNIDDAFTRRFNSIVYFPKPSTGERKALWLKAFPKQLKLSPEIDLNKIAKDYDLTGSHIMNIVHYISLQVLESNSAEVSLELLLKGIKKELVKEGKLVI